MATYLKPTSKLFDLPSRGSGELNLTDLMCPVCRGILIEPVTLPCAHSLCLRCLNGTIQHNSLSCPLCRVRVGSWLRTATKSDTLVNGNLWKLIKARFSKEIQAKNNGEDTELGSGFVTTTNKILSAAGEIRREYEAQLQLAEEEIRRRREAERLASEALIRQIQAEEREQINQLAKDNAVAKNLAKRSLAEKVEEREKYEGGEAGYSREASDSESEKLESVKSKDVSERSSNVALISKLRAVSYASEMKSAVANAGSYKPASDKYFFQKSEEPANHGLQKFAKQQGLGSKIDQSYMPKPGCSNSKIYGTQSKEELHVPSDVLNRKKKSLGIEVCLAGGDDDRRIGSAESTGSHDSINIEIHHFKPIKAMPRTPLRTMPDGRQIDPKLIRVVAILKRVQNAVPKPPTLMQLKRLSGCSYSAFKGKSKKVLKQDQRPATSNVAKEDPERRPSTSSLQNQQQTSNTSKLSKSQISETVRRLDLSSEISYDGNKNYAKNINRIINGTKVSKKLILDEDLGLGRGNKTTNGGDNPGKFKRRKHTSSSNEREESETDRNINDSGDEAQSSSSSVNNATSFQDRQTASDGSDDAISPAVENIAERIKKRKMCRGRSHHHSAVSLKRRRTAEKKTTATRKSNNNEDVPVTKATTNSQRMKRKHRNNESDGDDYDENIDSQTESVQGGDPIESIHAVNLIIGHNSTTVGAGNSTTCSSSGSKRSTRNSLKTKNGADNENPKTVIKSTRPTLAKKPEMVIEEEEEDEGVREQKRIERLLLQEKQDFELAQRLQAKFDEMERISGRTRGSRRGGAAVVVSGFNSKNIEQVFSAGRTVRNEGVGMKDRFSRQLLIDDKERSDGSRDNKRRVTRRRCV